VKPEIVPVIELKKGKEGRERFEKEGGWKPNELRGELRDIEESWWPVGGTFFVRREELKLWSFRKVRIVYNIGRYWYEEFGHAMKLDDGRIVYPDLTEMWCDCGAVPSR